MNITQKALVATLIGIASWMPALASDSAKAQSDRASTTPEFQAFKKAIRAQYDMKERAWAAGDSDGLVKGFYSPNAFTAAEGETTFFAMGRAEFLGLYKNYVADTTKIRIESVHTHVNGNMGWDWTNFYADVKPEKVKEYPPSPVRILFVWEQINGKWYCAGDVVLLGKFDTSERK